jgi:hypothetical protein
MGRSFAISGFGRGSSAVAADVRERMDRVEAARELELRMLLDSDVVIPGSAETYRQRAERLGVDRAALANVSKFMKLMGGETPATAKHGAPAPVEIRGERGVAADSWVDGHGHTHTEVYTRNGPLLRRVEVVEERTSPHTRLVTRMRGGR